VIDVEAGIVPSLANLGPEPVQDPNDQADLLTER
jgi:hypothetical protein